MRNLIKYAAAFCCAACSVLILFILPNFIYDSAMKEQEVSTISKAIFIPLFILFAVISFIYTKKNSSVNLQGIGLLFMGACIILLSVLNVYNLQMLLPLVKTNSICLAVMWIARILGGLTGAFCGLVFGSILSKGIWQYVAFALGGAVIFAFGISAPDKIPYELLFYSTGALSFITQIINIYFSQKGDRKNVF